MAKQQCFCLPLFWTRGVVLTLRHEKTERKGQKKRLKHLLDQLLLLDWAALRVFSMAPHGFLGCLSQQDQVVCSGSALDLCWGRQWGRPWEVVWVIWVMLTVKSKSKKKSKNLAKDQPMMMGNPLNCWDGCKVWPLAIGLNWNKLENLKELTTKYARNWKLSVEANQCPRCPSYETGIMISISFEKYFFSC